MELEKGETQPVLLNFNRQQLPQRSRLLQYLTRAIISECVRVLFIGKL